MTESDDDRLSALYRRIPRDEPDAQTDRRILDAAHAALVRHGRRRFVPWALAASVVLAAGIGLRVLYEAPVRLQAPVSMPANKASEEVPRKSSPALPDAAPMAAPPAQGADAVEAEQVPAVVPAESVSKRRMLQQREPAAALSADRADAFSRSKMGAAVVSPDAVCVPLIPADIASRDAWQGVLERVREAGDRVMLDCLERRYRQQFGAVVKPAPDR